MSDVARAHVRIGCSLNASVCVCVCSCVSLQFVSNVTTILCN